MMTINVKHNRNSIRLKEYDLPREIFKRGMRLNSANLIVSHGVNSQAGAYFVTICAHNRDCVFGNIVNGEMHVNDVGNIVKSEWIKTGKIRRNVVLDSFVIMPNHLHGIIIIIEIDNGRGVSQYAPTTKSKFQSPSQTLGSIVRGFKATTTKQINKLRNSPGSPVWQRNYFERVVRNERELNRIREYIQNNPFNWNKESSHELTDFICLINGNSIEIPMVKQIFKKP